MASRVALSSSFLSSLAARSGSTAAHQILASFPSSVTVCAAPRRGGGRGRGRGGGEEGGEGGAAFRVRLRRQLSESDCWWSGQTGSSSKRRTVVDAGRVPRPACGAARLFSTSIIRLSAAAQGAAAMGQEVVAAEEKMDPVQKRLMFDDECILVDDKDNVVGHESKYNCHLMEKIEGENLLHRAFSVFLFNSKNELLLQKRSATKVTFPMVWTNTCCSHPLYRESELIKEGHLGVRNAAQRKLFDELGIEAPDAPVDDFTCLGRILYKAPSDGKWGEHELDYLVFMKKDVSLKPNPEEVADVMYVTKEQLKELVAKAKKGEDGVKLSPWFQLVVENFLYDWWKRVEEGTLLEVADMKTIHKL